MSRSIKDRHEHYGMHCNFIGYKSNKESKRLANRKFRRSNSMDEQLSKLNEDDSFRFHHIRHVSDNWNFASDGMKYYVSFTKRRGHLFTPWDKLTIIKSRAK